MADSQKYKPLLHDNPLCGIDTYKDTLNLATGACTRQIKKLVLDGTEYWVYQANVTRFVMTINDIVVSGLRATPFYCTHYIPISDGRPIEDVPLNASYLAAVELNTATLNIKIDTYTTAADFKAYLAAQYANGTPVTVWYILPSPTTETITVPTGLSGTEEGYLTQSGTPKPTNPVYPTANNVEIWQHSLRKLTTATDTITTLPSDLYADGNNATVGISGNTVQNGTPTPSNPVEVNGVGVRTENLLPEIRLANGWKIGYCNGQNGDYIAQNYNGEWLSPEIPLSAGDKITVSAVSISNPSMSAYYWNGSTYINSASATDYSGSTFTAPANTTHIRIAIRAGSDKKTEEAIISSGFWVMLNTGSTVKPYEPYGYKIPISSANTTTPVYLGEVESTRKIKKLVLTGQESWNKGNYPPTGGYQFFTAMPADIATNSDWITTHFKNGIVLNGSVLNGSAFAIYLSLYPEASILPENATAADFKSYLAAQYAAGTPVTVWYILKNETTGIVNEPLRKIGDYADTLSGISIPTITGKDTFDVLTTLKPSEVDLTYHGWHDASVKEYDGSQWNE